MELYTLVLLFISTFVLSTWILNYSKKKKINLPGPTGLPFIGYFPFLTSNPAVKLIELSKRYGPLYKIRLGLNDVVVACNYEVIKEILEHDNCQERPPNVQAITSVEQKLGFGKGLTSFSMWKERRQMSMSILHDIGIGKISAEQALQEAIIDTLKRLQAINKNTIHHLKPYLFESVSSTVFSWMIGKKVPQDNPLHKEIRSKVKGAAFFSALKWYYYFPWIHRVGYKLGLLSYIKSSADLRKIISKEIEQREEIFDGNNIENLLDGYFLKLSKEKVNPILRNGIMEDLSFILYIAGSDAIANYLEWIFLTVAAFPKVQDRIHEELDAAYGSDIFPSYQNRHMTPYLEAVMCETFRWISISPLHVLMLSKNEFMFKGCWIPKNTFFVSVSESIFHDKSLFGDDADVFRPERFLSEDGQKLINLPYFIPFSIGSRSCPGKTHAKIELYLYVAAILQKFRISPPPGEQIDLNYDLEIAKRALPQKLCFELRQ